MCCGAARDCATVSNGYCRIVVDGSTIHCGVTRECAASYCRCSTIIICGVARECAAGYGY